MWRFLALPQAMPSAITEPRQSTTVPNMSKTSAFTLASSGFISVVLCGKLRYWKATEKAKAPARGQRYVRQQWSRTKNDVATVAEYWCYVPRGTWGTGRNACATGRQRQKTKEMVPRIRAGRELQAGCPSFL